MRALSTTVCICIGLLLVSTAAAQAPALETARGTVDKADKESLTIRPRDSAGKFTKSITLKLTGTSS